MQYLCTESALNVIISGYSISAKHISVHDITNDMGKHSKGLASQKVGGKERGENMVVGASRGKQKSR